MHVDFVLGLWVNFDLHLKCSVSVALIEHVEKENAYLARPSVRAVPVLIQFRFCLCC